MDKETCIVYKGDFFQIDWYFDIDGNSQPFDYFVKMNKSQRRKFFLLVKRMADFGKISDKTKFRHEGDEIYAFKPKPDRFLCFFKKGKKIIITNAFSKRQDKLPPEEKAKSLKCRKDYLERFKED